MSPILWGPASSTGVALVTAMSVDCLRLSLAWKTPPGPRPLCSVKVSACYLPALSGEMSHLPTAEPLCLGMRLALAPISTVNDPAVGESLLLPLGVPEGLSKGNGKAVLTLVALSREAVQNSRDPKWQSRGPNGYSVWSYNQLHL